MTDKELQRVQDLFKDFDAMPEKLNPTQAAVLLGLDKASLANMRSLTPARLPYIKIGRRVFYLKAAVAEFILKNTVAVGGIR